MRKEFKHFTTKKVDWKTKDRKAGNERRKNLENNTMTEVSSSLSVITSNVSRLSSPVKRQDGRREKIHGPTIYCLLETHSRIKNTNRLKGWKKTFPVNRKQKRARLAILILGKIDFKSSSLQETKNNIIY